MAVPRRAWFRYTDSVRSRPLSGAETTARSSPSQSSRSFRAPAPISFRRCCSRLTRPHPRLRRTRPRPNSLSKDPRHPSKIHERWTLLNRSRLDAPPRLRRRALVGPRAGLVRPTGAPPGSFWRARAPPFRDALLNPSAMVRGMKPYVICHMCTTIDGRILGDRWPKLPGGKDNAELFESTADTFGIGAWLVGTNTMREFPGRNMKLKAA